MWGLALVHGLAAGTDTASAWALALYAAAAGAVCGLAGVRVVRSLGMPPWALRFWPATAALVAVELVVGLALGPMHHGG